MVNLSWLIKHRVKSKYKFDLADEYPKLKRSGKFSAKHLRHFLAQSWMQWEELMHNYPEPLKNGIDVGKIIPV